MTPTYVASGNATKNTSCISVVAQGRMMSITSMPVVGSYSAARKAPSRKPPTWAQWRTLFRRTNCRMNTPATSSKATT